MVDIHGVNFKDITDSKFSRPVTKKTKKSEASFFAQAPKEVFFYYFFVFNKNFKNSKEIQIN